MLDLADDFVRVTTAFQRELYKEQIEIGLRSGGLAGFQLLGFYDFPGQGTSPVGMLNCFWESKGAVTPESFRQYCNTTVPLLRFSKWLWRREETFQATAELFHFGPAPLRNARPVWRIEYPDGRVLAEGKLAETNVPIGNQFKLGSFEIPLGRGRRT